MLDLDIIKGQWRVFKRTVVFGFKNTFLRSFEENAQSLNLWKGLHKKYVGRSCKWSELIL